MKLMKTTRSAIALAAMISLAACVANSGQKQTLGTLIGAGLGGLAGSQIGSGTGQLAAVGAGVLLGGLLGNEIGKSLDRVDKLYVEQTAQQSLESTRSGYMSSWTNPNSGNSGTFTPTRTYSTAQGKPCREYQTTVTIGGHTQQAYGTACRELDGAWKIVN